MSITYINIGATCDNYSQPALPSAITQFTLFSGSGGSRLFYKNTRSPGAFYAGTDSVSSLPIVSVSDYLFDAFATLNLLTSYSSTSPPNAGNSYRYLIKSGTSQTDPSTDQQYMVAQSSDWTTTNVLYNGISLNRSTSLSTAISNIRELVRTFTPVISSFTNSPSSGTVTSRSANYTSTDFTLPAFQQSPQSYYLRKTTTNFFTDQTYYKVTTGTEVNIETVQDVASQITDSDKVIVKFIQTNKDTVNEVYGLKLYRSDGTTEITDLSIVTGTVGGTPGILISKGSSQYILQSAGPTDYIDSGIYTLIRNGTNYLFIDNLTSTISTVPTTPQISFKDYWASGSTSADLGAKTIFLWQDLTPAINNNPIGTNNTVDIYRWKLNIPGNYYLYMTKNAGDDGGAITIGTVLPPANEGWAIVYSSTTSTQGALAYVRNGKYIALLKTSGFDISTNGATLTIGGTYSIFNCVKCTNALSSTTGLCQP